MARKPSPSFPASLIAAFWLLQLSDAHLSAAQSDHLSLDGKWEFTYTHSTNDPIPTTPAPSSFVTTIQIPGWWDVQLERLRNAPWFAQADFRETQGPVKYLAGIGWHRKTFQVPDAWRGRAVTLTIGRAISIVHVWLNGRHIASYDYGVYTPFEVDFSEALEYGKPNELLIAVDNTKGFAGGWAFIGNQGQSSGITESVQIDVSPSPNRFADLFIRPGKDLSEVEWNAELHRVPGAVTNEPSTIAWQVLDSRKNKLLAEGRVDVPRFENANHLAWRAKISGIQPWSDRHPNLYWTRLRWLSSSGRILDELEQRFGLRRFSLDGRKLLLNGKPIYLRGSFGNYYFPLTGTPPTDKEYWRARIQRLKSMGFNYINFAAQVCPRGMLEAADEEGMILQCGDHQTVLQPYTNYYQEVWSPIVKWTRRNPSMCIYGFGGERDYYEGIIEQFQRQHDLIKMLNPEALVMPQQAIRGIDYSFDKKDTSELTRAPFPHHAERLARYTKACDLFGHYSGGGLSYSYDKPPTWQKMDERFRIYSKPLSAHELFMGASYINPANAGRYTGRIQPYLYDDTRARLQAAGLLNKWPLYFRNSVHLQTICAKYNLEKVRKCHELVAFELLGAYDMHFLPFYTVGLLDEFMNFKPGNNANTYRPFNAENVLLLDYDRGESINRAYFSGEKFTADALLSLYGENDLEHGTFTWTLSNGRKAIQSGSFQVDRISIGCVATLGEVELIWPEVNETTRVNLRFSLKSNLTTLNNDWDFWVFPRRKPQVVNAAADDQCFKLLAGHYLGIAPLAEHPERQLHIVSSVSAVDLSHLKTGGNILLLGSEPFPVNKNYNSFRPGHGDDPHSSLGTVLAKHPIFAHLPNEGWADWHFYYILDGAYPFLIDDVAMGGFSPILELISPPSHVRKQAAIFERRIGKGRFLASSCVSKMDNPACVALLDGILEYVTSEKFHPAVAMELTPEILADYRTEPPPKEPNNHIPDSTFDRPSDFISTWQPFGDGLALDQEIYHRGRGSFRVQISPEQFKKNPDASVGASTTLSGFGNPQPLRLSAWCKTENVSAKKTSDFLIYAWLNYADGTRETIKLPLPSGTHEWQLVEANCNPTKELNTDQAPMLFISMSRASGTAWLDDLYFGPATEGK
jgi:Glycosyl hydrolases family 2, sugar binding domain/Glycosyl hydrolases family 2